MLIATEAWRSAHPGACVGALAMGGVSNPVRSAELDVRKDALEAELRSRFASSQRAEIKTHPRIAPYTAYYRRFDKTYHVQHQLESVVFKDRPIPRVAALVEAMFVGELQNLLLTAGHDLESVRGQVVLDTAMGTETYLTLGGSQQTLKKGDMFIRDDAGVLSSILYGPDHRTRILDTTARLLLTVYAPVGITADIVRSHLDDLQGLVRLVSPAAGVEGIEVIEA